MNDLTAPSTPISPAEVRDMLRQIVQTDLKEIIQAQVQMTYLDRFEAMVTARISSETDKYSTHLQAVDSSNRSLQVQLGEWIHEVRGLMAALSSLSNLAASESVRGEEQTKRLTSHSQRISQLEQDMKELRSLRSQVQTMHDDLHGNPDTPSRRSIYDMIQEIGKTHKDEFDTLRQGQDQTKSDVLEIKQYIQSQKAWVQRGQLAFKWLWANKGKAAIITLLGGSTGAAVIEFLRTLFGG
jgi:chromosome segregation ATPase